MNNRNSEKQLILATNNKHKVIEIKNILSRLPINILTLDAFPHIPEVIEDGDHILELHFPPLLETWFWRGRVGKPILAFFVKILHLFVGWLTDLVNKVPHIHGK